jgi:serine/threonine-protein kinase
MIHDVVYRMPPPPSQFAQVPKPVESVLAIALAKTPQDRFASAGELAAALAEAAAGFLSPTITERSAAVLRKQPWGPWQRRASTRAKTAAL